MAFLLVARRGARCVTRRRASAAKRVSGFPTKAAASRALRERLAVLDAGGDAFPRDLTVRDYITDHWLPYIRGEGRLRPLTIQNYEQLDLRLSPSGRRWHGDARGLGRRRAAGPRRRDPRRGERPGQSATCAARIPAAFRQACKMELIVGNPVTDTEAPKRVAAELRIPTAEELQVIIEQARGGRFEVAVLLSASTGARRGEVLGLRWQNVDLDAGRITIAEALTRVDGQVSWAEPKTANSRRTIPLQAYVVERLRAHKRAQAERLFAFGIRQGGETPVADDGTGKPFDPDSYTHRLPIIAAAAGVAGRRLQRRPGACGRDVSGECRRPRDGERGTRALKSEFTYAVDAAALDRGSRSPATPKHLNALPGPGPHTRRTCVPPQIECSAEAVSPFPQGNAIHHRQEKKAVAL